MIANTLAEHLDYHDSAEVVHAFSTHSFVAPPRIVNKQNLTEQTRVHDITTSTTSPLRLLPQSSRVDIDSIALP